ncbi:P-loop containing nucleoside triphosphate hydrolase protein [Hypoxylon trugodes]|uniref:P-loop containing nucleoside triphosphate hydrolase protein n=1 Tax=Hypoxylon trugodes TaxID=326681 RepID=UPI00219671D7|nr:P-loop containing nucleoside triphosphate hydrolase protein [Hypoxylon trugodes]KAI1385349.1 P-loop containing nucleoside triphosphate hydrolase protein [Hypoxylon trugodes]
MAPFNGPSATRPPSFGSKLPQFFQIAQTLVQGDLGMLQKTITELATEQGVLAIREMIDERILFCYNDHERLSLWRSCVRPLFLVLTEPRVVRSTILEVHTGTLYSVTFGHNASRLEVLFNFLVDLSKKWESPFINDDDGPKGQFLELCTAILAKVVDYNMKSLPNEIIPSITNQLRDALNILDRDTRSFWGVQAMNHIDHIRRRLGIFELNSPTTQLPSHGTFILRRDLPGELSAEGPRHDNDFEDIRNIQILPTMSELLATREEYRPSQDPSQLHLPGIKGLIDRHFRLLREDTIGQLKLAISEELHTIEHPESEVVTKAQSMIRKYSYDVAGIVDIGCTRRIGLEVHLKVKQPPAVSLSTKEAREDWWNLSRRLEIGALVCLLEKGTAVFCVVSESTVRPGSTTKTTRKTNKDGKERDLYSNEDFAYVNLNLAEPNESDLRIILRAFQSDQSTRRSLVEFPGVLLPSFKPTLSALQHIFKTLDLPFSDILAPTAENLTQATISQPLYSTQPGFRFNLRCITSDDRDLFFSSHNALDPEELCHRSSLDEGQAKALLNALERNLALIQGPPGTGKSYTGEAIIKVILANKEKAKTGPILCVCYTNHALDQLLEHLWHNGMGQIIRIGSGSKSSILGCLNLRNISQNIERTKSEKHASWKSIKMLSDAEEEMKDYLTGLKAYAMAQKVKDYIKDHATLFYRSIFGNDEDGWTTVTYKDHNAIFQGWIDAGLSSEDQPRATDTLKEQDPTTLSQQERVLVCSMWGSVVAANLEDEFVSLHDDYMGAKEEYENVSREVDLRALEEADIIGVTSTGLAKNLDMLRRLSSKILVCEEAGEVLESHILTALLPSVQHAILIGDHLQLRPQVANYELSVENPRGKQYSLDVSLFERLVRPARMTNLKVPLDTLEIQRRMHPSISKLIRDTMYPTLKDGTQVRDYPGVIGMKKRLYWFDHDKPEARSNPNNPTSTSRSNDFEVDMACALLSHIVRQGVYERNDIVVLTPYLGQLHKLKRNLQSSFMVDVEDRDMEALRQEGLDTGPSVFKQALGSCLRLATVDNFQGEEAKVVVVSLVRSNQDRQCGFLKSPNRINVLLSRAKHGMYILGNSETYGAVEMWSNVIGMMKAEGNFGTKLQLQCQRHKDTHIEVSNPDDFTRLSPEAGCDVQCAKKLDCGHTCRSKCHAATLHKAVKCLEPCSRLKASCSHGCPRTCGMPCEDVCSTVLLGEELHLSCGHILTSPRCWQAQKPEDVKCCELVEKTVPGCNHQVKVFCSEDVTQNSFVCQAKCGQLLPCGHACKDTCKNCRTRFDGEVEKEKHQICTSICGRDYKACKHACGRGCHPGEDCPPCSMPCPVQCSHSRCLKICSEACTPCLVETCSSICPHRQCTMPCAAPCNWLPCSQRCNKPLSCGHRCPSVCGEICPDTKYCQTCADAEVKAAMVDLLKLQEYQEVNLDKDPCIFPDCGHVMKMSSMDAQLGMLDHYQFADNGAITAAKTKTSSQSPSSSNIKACPLCRGSLRKISRYGALVRQGYLDESTKRFISRWHSLSVRWEQYIIDEQGRLDHTDIPLHTQPIGRSSQLRIMGSLVDQIATIHERVGRDRYLPAYHLYIDVYLYLLKFKDEEKPYKQTFSRIRDTGSMEGQSTIRTRGELSMRATLIRCYLVVLGDFLRLNDATRLTAVHFDAGKAIEECKSLIEMARETKYARHEAEGHIFYARLVVTVRHICRNAPDSSSGSRAMEKAEEHFSLAKGLVAKYRSAAYLRSELDVVRRMLDHSIVHGEVSVEEKRGIWSTMAKEFTEGQWYVCDQSHAFTATEELSAEGIECPECGAPAHAR